MRGLVLLTAFIIPFILGFSLVFSEEKKPGAMEQNVWQAYDQKGEFIGTLKKDKARFIFYSKDEIELKTKEKNVWEMYNQKGEFVGTLIKDKKYFICYDNQEKKVGVILENKAMMPWRYKERSTRITPEMAKIYLNVLEAIEKIK